MAVPVHTEFMLPILQLTSDGQTHKLHQYVDAIASAMGLTSEQRQERLPSQKQATYENRIGWAVTYMAKAGLVSRPQRATIQITQRGLDLLKSNPPVIDDVVLSQYPEFREFRAKRNTTDAGEDAIRNGESGLSPLERMAQANKDMRTLLASDLIDTMKQIPPAAFEQLVVDVLVSMGYGGTLSDAGAAIGRSGDGGIDGVIKEDRLGLDFIYVQAKRWENTVQRPQLQAFAGALMERNAQKGVFITTSDFSNGARAFVASIPTNIVLVDGQHLAELMIDYGVGVIEEQTYSVKRIDSEYFGE